MNKKYCFTGETMQFDGIKLKRIQALKSFGNVKKGDFGGWIEKEENLSEFGNAWVYRNSMVYGDAMVFEYARVFGNSRVFGNAQVYGYAMVFGYAQVFGYAMVFGDSRVYGDARVFGDTRVCGNALVFEYALIKKSSHYLCFQSFGSENRTTTVFKTTKGHLIKCGCFSGDIDEFKNQIEKTHNQNDFALEYLAICEVIKLRIKRWESEINE